MHYKSPPFHPVIRVPHLVFMSYCNFCYLILFCMEQMLMLILVSLESPHPPFQVILISNGFLKVSQIDKKNKENAISVGEVIFALYE